MGRASREKREARERPDAGQRREFAAVVVNDKRRPGLAALAAAGRLDMFTRWEDGEEVAYLYVPEEHRRSAASVTRYLFSCLPDTAAAARD